MQFSGWFAGAVLIVAVFIVMVARLVSKRSVLGGREPISLKAMYQHDVSMLGVGYELFEQVLSVVGEAYCIDPRLLRPSDELKKLYDLDSWTLSEGTERLNRRVAERFGIIHFEIEPNTIA
jgi:hypothetical protein